MSMKCCGNALIQQKETGETYTIDAHQLDWESEGSGQEREMGPEIQHQATLAHPRLGQLVFKVSEYPEGVFNQDCHELREHSLLKDFTYRIDVD